VLVLLSEAERVSYMATYLGRVVSGKSKRTHYLQVSRTGGELNKLYQS